ncbi:MAG: hypothetical protein H6Q68_3149 [Firmicutes bacterium]|nr:hypothetical protein [Bacillota bacterium]
MQNSTTKTSNQYPAKPITMIVPFSAGGGMDLLARALEKSAPKYLGQPLVVVNKPGGTGTIGWNELASASPDGYTIGMSVVELIVQPLYGSTKYHYPTALDPLIQISASPLVMIVQGEQPWQDITSLIEYGKQHPGQLKFGHQGIGSMGHIIGEIFAKTADITIGQVPFRGASEATAALLGTHVQFAVVNPLSVKEQIRNGTIRALAVSGEKRLADPVLAEIPTFKEQGLDIVVNNWFGVAAPKGLPPQVQMKLVEGFKTMIFDPDFKRSVDALGVEIEYLGPQETQEKWLDDNTKLTKIIQITGILDKIKEQKN